MERERLESVLELLSITELPSSGAEKTPSQSHVGNVNIGLVTEVDTNGQPRVQVSGASPPEPLLACSTVTVTTSDVGRQAVIVYEGGDWNRPIIIGLLHGGTPATSPQSDSSISSPGEPFTVKVDDEQVVLTAKKEIVLRCGKASITLTRAGKVIIRGAYLLSSSSGINKIKGGSIQLN